MLVTEFSALLFVLYPFCFQNSVYNQNSGVVLPKLSIPRDRSLAIPPPRQRAVIDVPPNNAGGRGAILSPDAHRLREQAANPTQSATRDPAGLQVRSTATRAVTPRALADVLNQVGTPSANVQAAVDRFPAAVEPDARHTFQIRQVLNSYHSSGSDDTQRWALTQASVQGATNSAATFGFGYGSGTLVGGLAAQATGTPTRTVEQLTSVFSGAFGPVFAAGANIMNGQLGNRAVQHMPAQFAAVPPTLLVPKLLFEAMENNSPGSGANLRTAITAAQKANSSMDQFGPVVGGTIGFGVATVARIAYGAGGLLGVAVAAGASAFGGGMAGLGSGYTRHSAAIEIPKFQLGQDSRGNDVIQLLDRSGIPLGPRGLGDPPVALGVEKVNLFYAREMDANARAARSQAVADVAPSNPLSASGVARVVAIGVPFGVARLADIAVDTAAHSIASPAGALALKALGRGTMMAMAIAPFYKWGMPLIASTDTNSFNVAAAARIARLDV